MQKEWCWPLCLLYIQTLSVSGMHVISLLSTTFLLTAVSPCTLLVPGTWGKKDSTHHRMGWQLCSPSPQLPGILPWWFLPGCPPPVWPSQDWAPRLTVPSLLHLGEYLIYCKCSIPLAALISTINLHTDVNELSVVCFDLNYLILGWIKIKSETKTE